MNAYSPKAPWWYWAVAILATVWMLFGVLAWVMDLRMTPDQLALLPDPQQQLYAQRPQWLFAVYAVAVFSGLVGAIGLLGPAMALPFPIVIFAFAVFLLWFARYARRHGWIPGDRAIEATPA